MPLTLPTSPDARRLAGVLVLATLGLVALAVSGWQPHDRATWFMEVAPIFIVLPVLVATYRRFPLTPLLYALVFAHALVLMLGGAYTYARVPLGFELQHLLDLQRNPYDRIGHFFQGFVPAIAAREILVRHRFVDGRRMLAFLVVCIVLAISVTYEFIEWGAAEALGQGADAFLGSQGDPWDTQWDMFTALIGGTTALLTMTRWHDRQIARIEDDPTLAPPRPSRALRNDWKPAGVDGFRGTPRE